MLEAIIVAMARSSVGGAYKGSPLPPSAAPRIWCLRRAG
jgi:hypothetical protein